MFPSPAACFLRNTLIESENQEKGATILLFFALSTDCLARLDLWGSFREPLAALITGLLVSIITKNTKEMPNELRAMFHTRSSVCMELSVCHEFLVVQISADASWGLKWGRVQ